jgi:uncharacterized repeat protein (TIGR03803 family)
LTPAAGGAWSYHLIYTFVGGAADGDNPAGNLAFDRAGNVYGVTFRGGVYQNGVIFELSPTAQGGWTEKLLYSFGAGGSADATEPYAGLTIDATGNLYGTTNAGGAHNLGAVYELLSDGSGGWTEQVLYSFQGGSDGISPRSTLILDPAGNLYGTTYTGGTQMGGTVFELTPVAGGGWTEKVLHEFTPRSSNQDGCNPQSGVIRDSTGNLYGTAQLCGKTEGIAFKLSPDPDGTWTEHFMHRFQSTSSTDGADAFGGLVMDSSGSLYGTTVLGGTYNWGTVYKLRPRPNGSYAETILHSFTGGADGAEPMAALAIDSIGNLYGTTFFGGSAITFSGLGVVFEIGVR